MPTQQGARTLLAHPHPIMIKGIKELIVRHELPITVVDEAYTPIDTLQKLAHQTPEMIMASAHWGLLFVKRMKKDRADTKILLLRDDYGIFRDEWALLAGAQGYVRTTGSEADSRLIDAIKAVASGNLYVEPEAASRIFAKMAGQPKGITPILPHQLLSPREFEIFELCAAGGTLASIGQILRIAPSTVETYREKIRKKLNVRTTAELRAYAVWWTIEGKEVFS